MMRWFAAATSALVVAALCVTQSGHSTTARPTPASATTRLARHEFATAPSGTTCRTVLAVRCYTPGQLRTAYGVNRLDADGAGTTIAVVVPYGSPTIAHDLQTFDKTLGLPDPPRLSVIAPVGDVPSFDPTDQERLDWAYETTLDVEYAHAMASGAQILVVATPVDETAGVQGFPEIAQAVQYVVDHRLATVISQSFGALEASFTDPAAIDTLRAPYSAAAAAGITVVAASGDTGPTGLLADLSTLSTRRGVTWPASDPLVTAVGGTALRLAPDGGRLADDAVWQDGYGASGGGVSAVFHRPAYQNGVAGEVGAQRGIPDISMSAGIDGGALVYGSYARHDTGWSVAGGTSEAAPLFAGVVALAVQQAGHGLGNLNPVLYRLGADGHHGLVDVADGNNGFGHVDGYPAVAGYDLASGWGTVDAAALVPALAG